MSLVNRAIPSLIGGVSQQPASLRHPSQVDAMVNCVPSVAVGVRKRTGTNHKARLSTADHTSAFVHPINRGDTEQYSVIVNAGTLNVYNLAGAAQTVTFPDGTDYLAGVSPRDDFAAVTVADYTFITNKTILAAMTAHTPTTVVQKLFVTIKVGVVDTTYFVVLNGVNFSYSTTSGTGFKTLDIVAALKTAINGGGLFTATNVDNTLIIVKNDNASFTWDTSDTYGDQASFGFTDTVNRYEQLPAKFTEGPVIKVKGDPDGSDDGYYVTWKRSVSTSDGVWQECAKLNLDVALDPATMPWQLVRNMDSTWTFKKATWDQRLVGDDNSNPIPSFVGSYISDIFFFRNRLGFLADENLIMSQAGSYFNFFGTTARAVVDSDPIDISASTTKVTFLKYAVPFNKSLLVMSSKVQFEMPPVTTLTPKTASLSVATEFEASDVCRPGVLGRQMYFPVSRGSFTGIREYFVDTNAIANDATDTTAHVPSFVPGGVFKLTTAPTEDMLFALVNNTAYPRSGMYVYNSFWNQDQKVQSAWHQWAFANGDVLVSVEVYGSTLVLIIKRADGVYMETMALEERPASTAPYTICLDRQVAFSTGVYDSVSKTTSWVLPYPDDDQFTVVAIDKVGQIGNGIVASRPSDTIVTIPGDYSTSNVIIGKNYTASITLSQFFNVDFKTQAIIDGRLQLRTLTVAFDRTGYFRGEVVPKARDTQTYVYPGRNLGLADMLIGTVQINSGEFSFPIMAKSDECSISLINDSHLPSVYQSLEWEGVFAMQARRM